MRTLILILALSLFLTLASTKSPAADTRPTTQTSEDKATLYKHLDDDFQDLLKSETNPQPLREAARLLAQTNRNSHWTDFMPATALLRQHRSKAAIPLLMKYLVEHASWGNNTPTYVDALSMLVGEKLDIPPEEGRDRQQRMEQAIINLDLNWWQPNKKTLTVDLNKMSDEKLKFIVNELLRHSDKELLKGKSSSNPDRLVSTQTYYEMLTASPNSSGRLEWWSNELTARMTPILLAQAGYVAKPTDDPNAGPTHVAFATIPLLVVLQQQGQAPMLKGVAADPLQNNATRLTCMLALHFAGNDIHSKNVLTILDKDTRLECRTLSLLTLALCEKSDASISHLTTALDDDNKEIRLAAIHSLGSLAPKTALPKLIKIVREGQPPELMRPAIRLLGTIGGNDAAAALVQCMERMLKEGRNPDYNIEDALAAFSLATHKDWMGAGAHQPDYYLSQCQKAIDWWKTQH